MRDRYEENDIIDFDELIDYEGGYDDRYDDFDDRYDDRYDDRFDEDRETDDLYDLFDEEQGRRSRDRRSYDREREAYEYDEPFEKGRNKKSGKPDKTFVNALLTLIPIVLIAVIGVSGYLFLKDFMTYRAAEKEYDNIKELIRVAPNMAKEDKKDSSESADTEEAEEEEDYSFPTIEIDYDGLEAKNSDFAGVLYIPALDLFYPVAYSHDNSEYLKTTFEGTNNPSGCIFVDCNANKGFEDLHTFVFGHNMKNETMFGSLKQFTKDNEIVRRSPYFYIFDKDRILKYEIFAYFTIPVTDSMFDGIPQDSDYDSFVNRAVSRTMYNPDEPIDFSEHPNLVTLSTCWGTGHQYDLEVMGVLKEVKWND